MAILDKVEITITTGGRVLQEYDVDADEVAEIKCDSSHKDSPHVVKYIEAIPGADFQLKYTMKENFSFGQANFIAFNTTIDGKRVAGPTISCEKYRRAGIYTKIRSGIASGRGSRWEERPFYWKNLSTTDEKPNATPAELKAKYAQLGTIQVIVSRKKGSRSVSPATGKSITLSDEPVPEKALKGRAIDSAMGHLLIGADALQVLGILPRTPEPVSLEARDPDSLSLEEARELLRRQTVELEAARIKIKKEKAEDDLRQLAAVQVKREASNMFVGEDADINIVAPSSKKPRREPEIIDLSD
ncbi:hypothetical protein LTR10_020107 [Elasticomyces elasticus]|uniref:DUF7918 domain-containing protein n=1 Tax=Exophiala sideris TaxID=1016849 RepID=A0ABR0IWI0_9EURO|nr:hypothetical protein LTR10_020107 [Elasticomyces elasticus]KAK5021568.1 hypothetical protein LTS07_010865 [Exophiala sideris]KAK5024800.1 hypothetical protein LTR13_010769 [Exophiala sideris]KAK5049705.1 hypothetical protein LTR69_010889 [Exophiala sideris]KAK5176686.1 hypothetical protein LTR44_010756 [Eurotiomycetes sp. CCFEE 6388]